MNGIVTDAPRRPEMVAPAAPVLGIPTEYPAFTTADQVAPSEADIFAMASGHGGDAIEIDDALAGRVAEMNADWLVQERAFIDLGLHPNAVAYAHLGFLTGWWRAEVTR